MSAALPVTYFLDVVRDSFGLSATNHLFDMAYLALSTVAIIIVGILVFRRAELRAKRLGLFDRKSEY